MKLHNPHDKFFKETFGNTEIAKDFLNNYLPQNIINIIDIDTLQPQKDSFINKELKESFSDLLFKVDINENEGYIYFLFEHKSYVSDDIPLQLLKYMLEIWDSKTKKQKTMKLPIIIPLVIYQGKDNWDIKTSLGEIITNYESLPQDIRQYVPNFKYLFYDISTYTDEEIKGQVLLKMILEISRDIFAEDNKRLLQTILKAAHYLKELADKQTGIEYFEVFIRYIFGARADLTKKDMNDIVRKTKDTFLEGSEVIMTLAEQLRAEGMEKGRAEGIEKGRAEALVSTTIKLLTRKFGILPEEYKAGIAKLDAITLEIIIDGILGYQDLEDIKKYIN